MRQLAREATAQRRQLEWSGPKRYTRSHWARIHRRSGLKLPRLARHPIRYKMSPIELETLQQLADGLTPREIAAGEYCGMQTVYMRIRAMQTKYGVDNRIALVAQGLKRGAVVPDQAAHRRLRRVATWRGEAGAAYRTKVARTYIRKRLPRTIGCQTKPYPTHSGELEKLLYVLHARTEEHALSILWAAGRVTSRDVPQTRNQYRKRRHGPHGRVRQTDLPPPAVRQASGGVQEEGRVHLTPEGGGADGGVAVDGQRETDLP